MGDQHDSKHEEKDCEERAQGDENTFAKSAPVTAVKLTVFGAGVGLVRRCDLVRVDVVHLVFPV